MHRKTKLQKVTTMSFSSGIFLYTKKEKDKLFKDIFLMGKSRNMNGLTN